jgi:3-dehydrosphinganine reductase
MDVNYWTTAYLCHATLKAWLRPSSTSKGRAAPLPPRHLVMTSSLAAFVGLGGYAPYSPAKAAMRNLADALRSEVNLYRGARQRDPSAGPPTDIEIHCVCPGTILSPGYEQENKTKHPITVLLEGDDPKQTEDEVAQSSIKSLEKGHYLIATHMLGELMKGAALQGSLRNNWLTDTLMSFVASIAWLFVRPDLDSKVFKYGKEHGVTAS